jgi:hypothetical protein
MTEASRPKGVAWLLLRLRGVLLCALPPIASSLVSSLVLVGCVVPLAPQFQDPPASQNYAPVIVAADPLIGSVISTTPNVPQTFTVTFDDPNVGDVLTARFLIDFPPDTTNTRVQDDPPIVPGSGNQLSVAHITPNCLLNALAKTASHQIMVVISDRGFLPPQVAGDLTRIPEGGHAVQASWTLLMECP